MNTRAMLVVMFLVLLSFICIYAKIYLHPLAEVHEFVTPAPIHDRSDCWTNTSDDYFPPNESSC